MVRFARSIDRRGRVLGGPAVRAASGGSLSRLWLPHRVACRLPLICAETPGQRESVDLVETTFPSWWRGAPNRGRGHRWSARSDARMNDLGAGQGRRMLGQRGRWSTVSAGCSPPHRGGGERRVRAGAQPYLVRGPTRIRRQDDRWVTRGARPRGLWGRPRTSRGGRGLAGAGRGASACLWAGHAPATVRPPQPRAGPRPGERGVAQAHQVWRTRRASLRATAKVARLPPWRALTCW